ncbi:MAG: nucleotidyltransferase family protein [Acidobacteria bacterium]|nr:nucleotidyltransferase family protein [Acidobacteriota bacterium]
MKAALLKRALEGSWRRSCTPLDLRAEELSAAADLAVRAGVAGLVWRRLDASSRAGAAGEELRRSYYGCVLKNELHRRELKTAVEALGRAGIDAVLVKGWALEDLYPEPGLRPCGDIDLCVRRADYRRADELMQMPEYREMIVDLHSGFDKFYDRRIDEVWARSRLKDLDGVGIRVLAPEDSLRFLCIHMLRHGANRALWGCDIAAAVEAAGAGFDWDVCLGEDRKQAGWTASAIALVCDMLGVDKTGLPDRIRNTRLPGWMIAAVEAEWAQPFGFRLQIRRGLRLSLSSLTELKRHWPNPVEATVEMGGNFNESPRWLYQAGCLGRRTAAYAAQSVGLMETPRARVKRGTAESAEMKTRKNAE